MSKKKKAGLVAVAGLGLAAMLTGTQSAQSRIPTFDAFNFKPAVDSTRFITLYDAEAHKQGEWNIGFYLDYARHPLELGSPVATRRVGVIDNAFDATIFGSVGLTNWFTIGAAVPIIGWNDYLGLNTGNPSSPARLNSGDIFSIGDVRLDLKFRLLRSKYVGMALVPYINFPTGKSTVFAGEGDFTGGGRFVLDFDPHERVKIGFNAGYQYKPSNDPGRKGITIRGTRIDDEISFGAGLNIRAHERLDIIAEGVVSTIARDFFKHRTSTPAEANGAFRVHATKGLDVTLGGGAGLTPGVGAPDFRAFLGLNYTHRREEVQPEPEPVRPVERKAKKIVITQVINFDFDRATIKPSSFGILDEVVSILRANPQVRLVRIEGHTDSIGSDAYNMRLSQRRANSVREYLVRRGIEPSRLVAEGYGESRPLTSNATAAGRAQNRRTEFNVLEQ